MARSEDSGLHLSTLDYTRGEWFSGATGVVENAKNTGNSSVFEGFLFLQTGAICHSATSPGVVLVGVGGSAPPSTIPAS
jgi:hypothetical protein